jgi:hypothetical protein
MNQPPAAVVDALDGADGETLQATIAYCEAKLEAEDEDEPTKAESEPPEAFEGDEEQCGPTPSPTARRRGGRRSPRRRSLGIAISTGSGARTGKRRAST